MFYSSSTPAFLNPHNLYSLYLFLFTYLSLVLSMYDHDGLIVFLSPYHFHLNVCSIYDCDTHAYSMIAYVVYTVINEFPYYCLMYESWCNHTSLAVNVKFLSNVQWNLWEIRTYEINNYINYHIQHTLYFQQNSSFE